MTKDPLLQAHHALKEDAADVGTLLLAEAMDSHFPSDVSRLHVCVYRLMVKFPGLGPLDAMEVLAKIGYLLEKEGKP
jgi:hypothetical protein